MDYTKHYNLLVDRAKRRLLEGYTEIHHIIPESMGGGDEIDNLVGLTAREHFIAHQLLVKMYPNEYGLIKAVNMMCIGQEERKTSKNRMYGWLRERFSKEMSRAQSGEGNSQYGSMWIHNVEVKESKKIPKDSKIPEGWSKGRKVNWDLIDNHCKTCGVLILRKSVFCKNCVPCGLTFEKRSKSGHKKAKVTREKVIEVLQVSTSYKDCMEKLGYPPKSRTGNTFLRIKRIAEEENLCFLSSLVEQSPDLG